MLIDPTYFSANNKVLCTKSNWESVKRTGNRGCERWTDKTEKSSAHILCSLGKHHTQNPTANFRCRSWFDVSYSNTRSHFFSSAEYFLSKQNSGMKCSQAEVPMKVEWLAGLYWPSQKLFWASNLPTTTYFSIWKVRLSKLPTVTNCKLLFFSLLKYYV